MRRLLKFLSFLILIFSVMISSGIIQAQNEQNTPTILWKINNGSSSMSIDEKGNIYMLNRTSLIKMTSNGQVIWNITIYPAPCSGPLVYGDTVYVTSYVQPPPYGKPYPRYLYAISKDGHIKWKLEFQPSGWGLFSELAINKYGEIFLNSDDGYTYAVYPNGSLKWMLNTDAWAYSPVIYHDTLYVASRGLYAMDFNGTIKWIFKSEEMGFTPAVGKDGTIYVAFDKLYAISPNGVVKWKASIRGYIPTLDYNKERIYTMASMLIGYNSTIFLYALNAVNGHVIWKTIIGGNGTFIPAVDKNGYIYLTNFYARNDSGYLFCISPDGEIIWRFKLDGGGTIQPPVIGKDGTIYVGTDKGIVYAIKGYANESKENSTNLWIYYTIGIVAVVLIVSVAIIYKLERR